MHVFLAAQRSPAPPRPYTIHTFSLQVQHSSRLVLAACIVNFLPNCCERTMASKVKNAYQFGTS
eukprot:6491702-Amphidinium_carterae.3